MADLEDILLDQNERLISVETSPVGNKKILVSAFDGVEELSVLPRFKLEVMTLGRPLKPSELLGQKLAVALHIGVTVRKFCGIVSSFTVLKTPSGPFPAPGRTGSAGGGRSRSISAARCSTT